MPPSTAVHAQPYHLNLGQPLHCIDFFFTQFCTARDNLDRAGVGKPIPNEAAREGLRA